MQKETTPAERRAALIKTILKRTDFSLLRKRCKMDTQDVLSLGTLVGTPGDQYGFIDNQASVLAVCHADYVSSVSDHFGWCHVDDWDTLVFCPRLDDRLGVYTILDFLPSLGIKFDILITDKEEIGQSTAGNFKTTKKYNWMFSFDRREDGTVYYKFESCMKPHAAKFFGVPGHGSFSDICRLGALGCGGVNVATGYKNEHSNNCYASMKTWAESVLNFVAFYRTLKDTHIPFKEAPVTSYYGNGFVGGAGYNHYGQLPDVEPPFAKWFGISETAQASPNQSKAKEESVVSGKVIRCAHCHKPIGATRFNSIDGEICSKCYNFKYETCSSCAEVIKVTSLVQYTEERTNVLRRVCRSCARSLKISLGLAGYDCAHCEDEKNIPLEKVFFFGNDTYGPDCASFLRGQCSLCGCIKPINKFKTWHRLRSEDLHVCAKCDAKIFKQAFGSRKNGPEIIDDIDPKQDAELLDGFECTCCKKIVDVGTVWKGKLYCEACTEKTMFKCPLCELTCPNSMKVQGIVPSISLDTTVSICSECSVTRTKEVHVPEKLTESLDRTSTALLAIPLLIE